MRPPPRAVSGIIDTVAGNGQYGISGDGGPAVDARLAGPFSVAVRAAGGFFVGDFDAQRVRLVAAIGPPAANAGPNQVVACSDAAGTPLTLDGSASSGGSAELGYLWTGPFPEGGGTATGIGPIVSLPIGASMISLVVAQGRLQSTPDYGGHPGGRQAVGPLVTAGPISSRKGVRRFRARRSAGKHPVAPADAVLRLGRVPAEAGGPGARRTRDLPAGTYRATIQMPDGRRFIARFQLR